jgi:hypothetical protein
MALKQALGVDIKCIDDIDPHFTLVGGGYNVGCAQARRTSTPRGALHYAQGYGRDLGQYLNGEVTTKSLQDMRKDAAAEAAQDERVKSLQVAASWDPRTETVTLDQKGKTKAGEFRLIRRMADVTTTVLTGDE